jgi:hypothetical protein
VGRRADSVAHPARYPDLDPRPDDLYLLDLGERHMPGPPADDDLHLAADPVQDHLETREARRDVQHRSYDRDRQQQDARKENRITTYTKPR